MQNHHFATHTHAHTYTHTNIDTHTHTHTHTLSSLASVVLHEIHDVSKLYELVSRSWTHKNKKVKPILLATLANFMNAQYDSPFLQPIHRFPNNRSRRICFKQTGKTDMIQKP